MRTHKKSEDKQYNTRLHTKYNPSDDRKTKNTNTQTHMHASTCRLAHPIYIPYCSDHEVLAFLHS